MFFERKAIVYFLKSNNYDWKKYNELMAAVVMSKIYSAGTDLVDAPIGFAIKEDYFRQPDDEPADLEKLHYIIDKMKEDDTPIDMVISHLAIDEIPRVRVNTYGWTYQIKRFIDQPGEDPTDKLIEFLNEKIPKKYAKVNARLLILIEIAKTLNLRRVADEFKPDNFPFTHVQFIAFDFTGGDQIRFGDIWPERHLLEGNVNRFFE